MQWTLKLTRYNVHYARLTHMTLIASLIAVNYQHNNTSLWKNPLEAAEIIQEWESRDWLLWEIKRWLLQKMIQNSATSFCHSSRSINRNNTSHACNIINIIVNFSVFIIFYKVNINISTYNKCINIIS